MIKGVNRRIVEISNTDNVFFEKAVLYIRPEKISYPQTQIEMEAKYYLNELTPHLNKIKRKRTFLNKYVIFALSFMVSLTILAYVAFYFYNI